MIVSKDLATHKCTHVHNTIHAHIHIINKYAYVCNLYCQVNAYTYHNLLYFCCKMHKFHVQNHKKMSCMKILQNSVTLIEQSILQIIQKYFYIKIFYTRAKIKQHTVLTYYSYAHTCICTCAHSREAEKFDVA